MNNSNSELPGFADILAAAQRLAPVAARTPMLESKRLNETVGRRVLVKAESLQHGGAFKFRGAWNHLRALRDELEGRNVLAVSSGNHGAGFARAAGLLGLQAAVVMPHDAPEPKARAVAAYGAEIIGHDRATDPREMVAARVSAERGAHFVPPYDDPLVIAGQGTIGLEIAADAREIGIDEADVLIPCGGGGLSSGCAIAFESEAPGLRVRPVEPEGFDDWTRSLLAGEPLANESLSGSICDALLAEKPGQVTWETGKDRFGPGVVVTDEEALGAIAVAWELLRIVLEPGGAVGLAAALRAGETDRPVIVVASGGNVSREIFIQALEGSAKARA